MGHPDGKSRDRAIHHFAFAAVHALLPSYASDASLQSADSYLLSEFILCIKLIAIQ